MSRPTLIHKMLRHRIVRFKHLLRKAIPPVLCLTFQGFPVFVSGSIPLLFFKTPRLIYEDISIAGSWPW